MNYNNHELNVQNYYKERQHSYLCYVSSNYVNKCIEKVEHHASLSMKHNILEVGSGKGRFTIPLLKKGYNINCVEYSENLIEEMKQFLGEKMPNIFITSIENLPETLNNKFNRIIGFYVLHHIKNLETVFNKIHQLLAENGSAVFLEPNPWNPLFMFQYSICKDFLWREEWRTYIQFPFWLRKIALKTNFTKITFSNFGFFPPQIYNTTAGKYIEDKIEKIPLLKKFLPYQIIKMQK